MDEGLALKALTRTIKDQECMEREISQQAHTAIVEVEDGRDHARITRLIKGKRRLISRLEGCDTGLNQPSRRSVLVQRSRCSTDCSHLEISRINNDIANFEARIMKRHEGHPFTTAVQRSSSRFPEEDRRNYLLRTGKITPFAVSCEGGQPGIKDQLTDTLQQAEGEAHAKICSQYTKGFLLHSALRKPGFIEPPCKTTSEGGASESAYELWTPPRKRMRGTKKMDDDFVFDLDFSVADSSNSDASWQRTALDSLSPLPLYQKDNQDYTRHQKQLAIDVVDLDDGNEAVYRARLRDWSSRRSQARHQSQLSDLSALAQPDRNEAEECFRIAPCCSDLFIDEDLRLPGDIHPSLFAYQKTGVRWLAELYKKKVGGIIGDEMGLGKTVQAISFVAALHYSKKLTRPVIVIVPATLLRLWVSEFHRWWPPLRVSMLHSTGSGMSNSLNEDGNHIENRGSAARRSRRAAEMIIENIQDKGHVLITTYSGLQNFADILLDIDWGYAILDEGHKIRNPNAEITVTCKELRTQNRIILSGTPVQNNLTELWSLFDFIYPMRLGTLINFRSQFEIPIRQGGYANASTLQILTAEKCAEALKQTIGEFLIQRLKRDVAADLPEKTEQVLFCRLTERQRHAYESFLSSDEVSAVLNRQRQSFYAINILRKICNHPDLLSKRLGHCESDNIINARDSAKLQLTLDLLQRVMIPNGHKTLLFSQGKLMLNFIEKCIRDRDIEYLRMDGETNVGQRQSMIDRFNNERDIHVFLLTTRTGGLGINLTGADRIIIFDPDWNPSTDLQARERAWRLGQHRPVKIYRLITEGTIEEKIYHRQIFKQLMTNKVLKDPKQRSSWDLSDLYDLFSYTPKEDVSLEQGAVIKVPQKQQGSSINRRQSRFQNSLRHHQKPCGELKGLLQLERISSLSAMEPYRDERSGDEKRLLEGIFSRSVENVHDHEELMNGQLQREADSPILKQEAMKVARQAATHLRQSVLEACQMPIGTVTWTGEVGSGGRSKSNSRPKSAPPSAAILSNLASQQNLDFGPCTQKVVRERHLVLSDFVSMIRQFFARHNGVVASQMLVDHFNRFCQGKRQSDEFKRALNEVACLFKDSGDGAAVWKLKTGL